MTLSITFDRGTLELSGLPDSLPTSELPGVVWDPRTSSLRAPAYRWREIQAALQRERRSGSELGEVELIETRVTSVLVPGFALDLAAVFARR